MVVERHPTAGFEAAGLGFADVVHERGEPQHEVRGDGRFVGGLQMNGLIQNREAVLVHVLVPMVLVDLEASAGTSGRETLAQARVHQQLQAGPRRRRHDEFDQFVTHRSALTTSMRSAMLAMASTACASTLIPNCEDSLAARIMRSGSSEKESAGAPGVRSRLTARSSRPSKGSTNCHCGRRTAMAFTVKSLRPKSGAGPRRTRPVACETAARRSGHCGRS